MKQSKIVFACGGTGGHIFPAVEMGKSFQSLLYLGSGLSKTSFFPKHLRHFDIPSSSPRSFKGIIQIIFGICKAITILRREKPSAVVGFGSYHSFPPLFAAYILRIPIYLVEMNAIMGRVNRFFEKKAMAIFSQFPIEGVSSYPITIPIRQGEKISKEQAIAHYGLDPSKKTLLVFGGSQGAKILQKLPIPKGWQVIHFTGDPERTKAVAAHYAKSNTSSYVREFEAEMDKAWIAADLALCRSGAMSVAESLHFAVPCLFVPYPFATDNHQRLNAEVVVQLSGLILAETDLSELEEIILRIEPKIPQWKEILVNRENVGKSLYQYLHAIHFIGVGGIGMSGLALLHKESGGIVSGSDKKSSPITAMVAKKGIPISIGHLLANVPSYGRVCFSTAISKDNPEIVGAKKKNMPMYHRSSILSELFSHKQTYLVSGSHGKTSTTGMFIQAATQIGLDPTWIVGGIHQNFHTNAHLGSGSIAIAEADESDGSFLHIPCHGAIVTNIDKEHLDHWKSYEKLIRGFERFFSTVDGPRVVCGDDQVLKRIAHPHLTYGRGEDADIQLCSIEIRNEQYRIAVRVQDQIFQDIPFPKIGEHQVINALGVVGMLFALGHSPEKVLASFATYKGMQRRLEIKGQYKQATLIDDYAHHPTEVQTTLKVLREIAQEKKLIVAFQPHRYSRLKECFDEFSQSFSLCDRVVITDVYGAGEKPNSLVSGKKLAEAMNADYVPYEELTELLKSASNEPSVIVTMGAGNIQEIGEKIASHDE